LQILGRAVDLELELAAGRSTVHAMWEPARAAQTEITRVVRESEAVRGVAPTCREGCSACCLHLVPISTVEAVRLARLVDALPTAQRTAVRARFDDAVRRLERAGLLDANAPRGRAAMTAVTEAAESPWDTVSRRYRALAIACPLLVRHRCSVYEERPLVCREYLVSSPPERCATPGAQVKALPRPVRMSEVLADATTALTGDEIGSIPLVLALEWTAHHGPSLDAAFDAEELLAALASSVVVEGD
jgi:Fe-S-cluster containining protein